MLISDAIGNAFVRKINEDGISKAIHNLSRINRRIIILSPSVRTQLNSRDDM
jgi:hypothetical protein